MDYKELITTLKTADSVEKIDKRRDEIGDLIPSVKIMFGYDQKNSAHPGSS